MAAHDEKDCEWQLEQSIKAAMLAGVMKPQRLDSAIVHTTVQPSAIADHTDSRLLSRAREQLVAPAQEAGIELRQRHARLAKTANAQGWRSAHAQQRPRMQVEGRRPRTWPRGG